MHTRLHRPLRLVLYGFSVASAGVATLISLPQLAGALGGAPSALPLEDVLTNLGIDLGAVGLFAWLFSLDWAARERQIARLGRESALAALSVQLSSGRRVRLEDLQGFARVVLLAGTTEQVAAALAAAAPLRESLQARGVLVVPLPIYGGVSDGAAHGVGLAYISCIYIHVYVYVWIHASVYVCIHTPIHTHTHTTHKNTPFTTGAWVCMQVHRCRRPGLMSSAGE